MYFEIAFNLSLYHVGEFEACQTRFNIFTLFLSPSWRHGPQNICSSVLILLLARCIRASDWSWDWWTTNQNDCLISSYDVLSVSWELRIEKWLTLREWRRLVNNPCGHIFLTNEVHSLKKAVKNININTARSWNPTIPLALKF